jgi:hypothetical protein
MNPQELLTQIGAALAEDADDVTKQRGVNACRTVLTVLGAKAGEPMQLEAQSPPPQPAPQSPFAAAASAMANVPPTAILDAVIAKLQATLPPDTSNTEPEPERPTLRIPFIPVPNLKGRGT